MLVINILCEDDKLSNAPSKIVREFNSITPRIILLLRKKRFSMMSYLIAFKILSSFISTSRINNLYGNCARFEFLKPSRMVYREEA